MNIRVLVRRVRFPKQRLRETRESTRKKLSPTEVFAGCAVLISAAALVFSTHQNLDAKRLELQKPFHEERFRTYVELSDTVAKLATLPQNSKEHAAAVQRYWQLALGKVQMLADADVQEMTHTSSEWVRECFQEKSKSSKKDPCTDVSGHTISTQVSETVKSSFRSSVYVPMQ